MLGRCLTTSASPTTATSRDSMTVSNPVTRMRSPPRPKNDIARESARRSDSINCAPYSSPEASPAEMRMVGMWIYLICKSLKSWKHKGHEAHKGHKKFLKVFL